MKNLGDYYDLCVQSDSSSLCDNFENYHEMCLNTYDPCHFHSATGLLWDSALKKTAIKLEQ